MKTWIACLTLACLTFVRANAADSNWLTDLPKAQAVAKENKKLVLIDFTGSDWCPPCKQLHKNVLTSSAFEEFATKNLVLVELDFPTSKKQSKELAATNEKLKDKFNIQGFPTIIVLDADGKELGRHVGYSGESPKEFIAKIESFSKK